MSIVNFYESAHDGDIGIKVSFSDGDDVGQGVWDLARENSTRGDQVWIWGYAAGMDLQGPALHVGYARGRDIRVEMVDPSMLALYYVARNA